METQFQIFIDSLNWTYILIYCLLVYGIKNIDDLKWYNKMFEKSKIKDFKITLLGIIIMVIQCIIQYVEYIDLEQDSPLNAQYIASLLRSWIFSSVFYSLIIKKIKFIQIQESKNKKSDNITCCNKNSENEKSH